MSKHEGSQPSLSSNGEERMMKEGRYYVQALTDHIFLVRECQSTNGKPGSDDTIVKSFNFRYDAYHYANSKNE
jgi:hypothetical protein